MKILCSRERIIGKLAAAKRELSFIFRIGWTEQQRAFRCAMLNQKRNQFGGAISYYDIVRIDVTVLPDCLTKRTVLPVRVSGDDIKVLGKLFFLLVRTIQAD